MDSSTTEADIEAQTSVVTALPANNALAGASSTDITPNDPQPPPNHNPRVINTNNPANRNTLASQPANNLEGLQGTFTCPTHHIYIISFVL